MNAREDIVKAATRRMAQMGADATSLQSIADDVGIRKPSVLYHFPNKAALREAVLDEILLRWSDVLPRLFKAMATEPTRRFEALTEELISFFLESPVRARLILREMLDRPTIMRARLEEHVEPWIDVIANEIRRGQARGTVAPDVDPGAFVWILIHSVIGNIALIASLDANGSSGANGRLTQLMSETLRIARVGLFKQLTTQTNPKGGDHSG